MTDDKIAFSVAEACSSIGIGRSLFYELVARGDIPAIKLGRRTLVRSEYLKRYIASLPKAKID
jgi:excisionase family DNA binding protein